MNKRLLQKNAEKRIKMTGKRVKPKAGGTLKSIMKPSKGGVFHI